MVDIRRHWVGLSESDVRSMLIALVGLDFGPEPENYWYLKEFARG